MRAAKPSAQSLRLGLNVKHGFDAGAGEAKRRCKRTWRSAGRQGKKASNFKVTFGVAAAQRGRCAVW